MHEPTSVSPRRWWVLAGAVLMQLCLGATYAWSVFVAPLKGLTGLTQGPVQAPFTVFYIVFPATMVAAGSLLERLGPRPMAVLGGLLFGGGWMVAGLGARHFGWTVAGVGVLGGLGVGCAYIVPIATCVRWFPARPGLVTGLAVAGFGGGAALVTQIASRLMQACGATPFAALRALGLCFAVLVGAAGLLMWEPPGARATGRTPERGAAPPAGPAGPQAAGGRRSPFPWLYLSMAAGLAAGFAVNANLKELFPGGQAAQGAAAVSLFALANALGRVTWGAVYDRLRTTGPLQANLLLQAAVLAAYPLLVKGIPGFYLLALAAGFNYGGVLVLYAAAVNAFYGPQRMARVYGRLFSANIVASGAPMLAGFGYERWGTFTLPLLAIAGLLGCAVLLNRGRLPRTR